MKSGILTNLTISTRAAASHACASYRFWLMVGLLGDLSLQNDPDGVFIAIDGVQGFNFDPDKMEVPLVRDAAGEVVDLLHTYSDIGDDDLVRLAREIALLSEPDVRCAVLEAACLALIRDRDDGLGALLNNVTEMRAADTGLDAFSYPLPAFGAHGANSPSAVQRADVGSSPPA